MSPAVTELAEISRSGVFKFFRNANASIDRSPLERPNIPGKTRFNLSTSLLLQKHLLIFVHLAEKITDKKMVLVEVCTEMALAGSNLTQTCKLKSTYNKLGLRGKPIDSCTLNPPFRRVNMRGDRCHTSYVLNFFSQNYRADDGWPGNQLDEPHCLANCRPTSKWSFWPAPIADVTSAQVEKWQSLCSRCVRCIQAWDRYAIHVILDLLDCLILLGWYLLRSKLGLRGLTTFVPAAGLSWTLGMGSMVTNSINDSMLVS